MFNLFLIVMGLVLMIGLYYVQKIVCQLQNKWIGLILPLLVFALSIYVSVPNFKKAFYIQFSYGAFIASLMIFFFFFLFAIAFSFEYWRQGGRD